MHSCRRSLCFAAANACIGVAHRILTFLHKCDQLKPNCRQCTRSGLKCGGYDRALIFVNTRPDPGDASVEPRDFAPTSYSSAIRPALVGHEIKAWPARGPIALSPLLDQSLEGTAATAKYLFLYWNFLLPNNGQHFTPGSVNYSTTGWMQIVDDLSHRHDGVRLGLLFNALALVGQRTGQASVLTEAWRMYSKALQTLGRSLARLGELEVAETSDDELLMTAALFAAFEVRNFLSWPPASHRWSKSTAGFIFTAH